MKVELDEKILEYLKWFVKHSGSCTKMVAKGMKKCISQNYRDTGEFIDPITCILLNSAETVI